jgi:hypothetical protein
MDEQIDRAYYSESQNEVLVAQLAAVEAEVKELRAVPAKIVSCDVPVAQRADATGGRSWADLVLNVVERSREKLYSQNFASERVRFFPDEDISKYRPCRQIRKALAYVQAIRIDTDGYIVLADQKSMCSTPRSRSRSRSAHRRSSRRRSGSRSPEHNATRSTTEPLSAESVEALVLKMITAHMQGQSMPAKEAVDKGKSKGKGKQALFSELTAAVRRIGNVQAGIFFSI